MANDSGGDQRSREEIATGVIVPTLELARAAGAVFDQAFQFSRRRTEMVERFAERSASSLQPDDSTSGPVPGSLPSLQAPLSESQVDIGPILEDQGADGRGVKEASESRSSGSVASLAGESSIAIESLFPWSEPIASAEVGEASVATRDFEADGNLGKRARITSPVSLVTEAEVTRGAQLQWLQTIQEGACARESRRLLRSAAALYQDALRSGSSAGSERPCEQIVAPP